MPKPTRRTILQAAAAGSLFGLTNLSAAKTTTEDNMPDNATILFQGDSITDAGRSRKNVGANNAASLGNGYPNLIASELLSSAPQKHLRIFNRGISGNKVPDLQKRWQADCLDLKPDLVSILIGVNDIWHKLNGRYDGTVEQYEAQLSELIKQTREALPKVRVVICEPFVLRCGAVNDNWFPEFEHRRAACQRVSEAHGCTWVPFQKRFDQAVKQGTEPAYWAGDGVHPTLAGHGLMARTWRDVVCSE